ncbi:Putative membrane protein [Gloeomargarita lithophora Alchichica-D10]|uniref:Glycerol-3-phosphate acyltransferase n=1 Tax=Gloeomargarita lithophora Alchichica-D10 TaxID=1188229 RepID=A0A1J0ACQ3_9CYAN|nr:glycerol-3-phosphate 1-O-acyltransferase PlsY [Gloeomargarita lithophora]APB33696.1 Putative membrane protein [Gloeomargarita lithophora Alchichica-D10]
MAVNLLLVLFAYLCGAFPPGYVAGRLAGIDIRRVGSGSTGATNVLRTLGKWPALAVFLLDVGKGVAAVALTRWLWQIFPSLDPGVLRPWWELVYALTAVVGHSKSLWINWRGGKSVATGLGLLAFFAWPVALGALGMFGLVVATVRIVSLGSLLACMTALGLAVGLAIPLAYQVYTFLATVYIIWCHRSNIQRLLKGTEPRLGEAKPTGE